MMPSTAGVAGSAAVYATPARGPVKQLGGHARAVAPQRPRPTEILSLVPPRNAPSMPPARTSRRQPPRPITALDDPNPPPLPYCLVGLPNRWIRITGLAARLFFFREE